MPNEIEAFLGRALDALPHLRPAYEATFAECQALGLAEGAPGEFLFEHTLELTERLGSEPEAARSELAVLAQVHEQEYGRDPAVDDLIRTNVLGMLPPGIGALDTDGLLGPKLAAALREQRGWRAGPGVAAFVSRLVAAVPALEPLARENAFGDHGDVLVHPLLGDVVAREVDNLRQGRVDEVRAVLDVLEAEFAGAAEEPIAVSFVENLPYPDEPGAELVDLLGPRLRAELERQRSPRPA